MRAGYICSPGTGHATRPRKLPSSTLFVRVSTMILCDSQDGSFYQIYLCSCTFSTNQNPNIAAYQRCQLNMLVAWEKTHNSRARTIGAFKIGTLEAGGWRRPEVVTVPRNCHATFSRCCHRDEPHCDARDNSSASVKAYTARPMILGGVFLVIFSQTLVLRRRRKLRTASASQWHLVISQITHYHVAFEDSDLFCATCLSGPHLTNDLRTPDLIDMVLVFSPRYEDTSINA